MGEEQEVNMKVNIGVVILNYLAYEETIKCVEDFKAQNRENINLKIIIVDNHSLNESERVLRDKFKDDDIVVVVRTNRNLGFANGNNFGYKKLLEYMQPDYVIFSNDDIMLNNDNLFSWIIEKDKKYQFGMLGPSIFSVNGKFYQSPLENYTRDLEECKKILKQQRIILLKISTKRLLRINKSKNKNKPVLENSPYYEKETTEKTLHGAFQIMSRRYLNLYAEPYDSGTFLYMEEYILKLRCDKSKLPMVYSPDYKVLHLQAVSTGMMYTSQIKKDCFRLKNEIKSLKHYMKLL